MAKSHIEACLLSLLLLVELSVTLLLCKISVYKNRNQTSVFFLIRKIGPSVKRPCSLTTDYVLNIQLLKNQDVTKFSIELLFKHSFHTNNYILSHMKTNS